MKNPVFLIIPAVLAIGAIVFFVTKSGQAPTAPSAQPERGRVMTVAGYSGNVLSGSSSPYLEFNRADYQKALAEGKIIVLDFFANWCPICRAEAPHIRAGFDSLTSEKVIGFRVNFNDSDTDENEKALAQEFNIPYQHTKVILKNGQEVKRSGDQWTGEIFAQEINSTLE